MVMLYLCCLQHYLTPFQCGPSHACHLICQVQQQRAHFCWWAVGSVSAFYGVQGRHDLHTSGPPCCHLSWSSQLSSASHFYQCDGSRLAYHFCWQTWHSMALCPVGTSYLMRSTEMDKFSIHIVNLFTWHTLIGNGQMDLEQLWNVFWNMFPIWWFICVDWQSYFPQDVL